MTSQSELPRPPDESKNHPPRTDERAEAGPPPVPIADRIDEASSYARSAYELFEHVSDAQAEEFDAEILYRWAAAYDTDGYHAISEQDPAAREAIEQRWDERFSYLDDAGPDHAFPIHPDRVDAICRFATNPDFDSAKARLHQDLAAPIEQDHKTDLLYAAQVDNDYRGAHLGPQWSELLSELRMAERQQEFGGFDLLDELLRQNQIPSEDIAHRGIAATLLDRLPDPFTNARRRAKAYDELMETFDFRDDELHTHEIAALNASRAYTIEAWGRANDPVGYRDYVAAGAQFDREGPARDAHIRNAVFSRWSTMHDLLLDNDVDPYTEETGTAELVTQIAQTTDWETANSAILAAAVDRFLEQHQALHEPADNEQRETEHAATDESYPERIGRFITDLRTSTTFHLDGDADSQDETHEVFEDYRHAERNGETEHGPHWR